MNGLGERIKELRQLRGFTQDDVAEKLGMKRSNFSSYETGRTIPPSNILSEMATLFNTSTDYLLGKTENSDPVNDTELEFIKNLDLSYKELFTKYNFKLDGEEITEEEAKGIIAFLRASRQLK